MQMQKKLRRHEEAHLIAHRRNSQILGGEELRGAEEQLAHNDRCVSSLVTFQFPSRCYEWH